MMRFQVEVEKPATDAEQELLVEGQIMGALKEEGKLRIVSDRGLEKGDVAVLDFEARDKETKQPIAGTKREGMQLDTTLPDNSIGLPGTFPCPFLTASSFCLQTHSHGFEDPRNTHQWL